METSQPLCATMPVLTHAVKEFFWLLKFPVISLFPLPLVSLGISEKILSPSSLLSLRIFIDIHKMILEPPFLQTEQAQLSQLLTGGMEGCSILLIILVTLH